MGVYTLSKNIAYDDMLNSFLKISPKNIEGINNTSYMYYRQQLYLKLFSMINIKNMPNDWNRQYLYDNLFRDGYICVVKTTAGVLPLIGSYRGLNLYGWPLHVIIANPVLGTFERTLNKDAELLFFNYVNGHFASIEPLIKRYALMLAQCDASINTNLMNTKTAHVFIGDTDAEIETYKKAYDQVTAGRGAIFLSRKGGAVMDKNIYNFLDVKNMYIANDIMLTKRSIMNEFLTEIGINNANTDKRERLNADEVNANNTEVNCLINLWVNTLNECCERINTTFGLNISFEINKDVTQNESGALSDDI